MDCTAVTLKGHHVTLEPLGAQHLDEIRAAAADGELWKLFFTSVPAPQQTEQWLETALAMQRDSKAVPFAVRHNKSGKIIGSTRFCNIELAHRRVEIGYTWYAASMQRSAVNTECKLLLLSHAFEQWQCIAVEFRTDWFNKRSQAAIERLGAKRDGVLRSHMILPDGRVRDTVVYSILQHEWAGLKKNLQFLQQKYQEDQSC